MLNILKCYVGILSLYWLVFQHVRMQPAQQMAWPHYRNLLKLRDITSQANKDSEKRKNQIIQPFSIYSSNHVSGGFNSAIVTSAIYRTL